MLIFTRYTFFSTFILQANGKIITNGMKDNNHKPMSESISHKHDKPKESFEPIPMLVACLTYMGFYFLMLLGFLNQLLFAPKVAKERNREVSHFVFSEILLLRLYKCRYDSAGFRRLNGFGLCIFFIIIKYLFLSLVQFIENTLSFGVLHFILFYTFLFVLFTGLCTTVR